MPEYEAGSRRTHSYHVSVSTRCVVLRTDPTGGVVNTHALYSGDQNVLPLCTLATLIFFETA
jgi:hypothetical protein